MSFSDHDILELNTLCSRLVDGTLTDAERARLESWLRESAEARVYYVKLMGQSASLHEYAAEMQSEPRVEPISTEKKFTITPLWWIVGGLMAACLVVLIGSLRPNASLSVAEQKPAIAPTSKEFVARVTGAQNLRWADGSKLGLGDHVTRGARLDLADGVAEVTFDSGARVTLQGRTTFDVNSAWDSTLRRGQAKANVPPQAIGFRISNAAVDVVDLGTEFSMNADPSGATDVVVLKGEVEASPRVASESDAILMRAKEGRRFDASGSTDFNSSEDEWERLNALPSLDRLAQTMRAFHWSFDETRGEVVEASAVGAVKPENHGRLAANSNDALNAAHAPGHRNGGLHFTGELSVKASVPALSSGSAHTVTFWVRVPQDALLSDAYAMVAWRPDIRKLDLRPVHISWNRNPSEGNLGAIRTDFGGGCAIGTTSIRDGQWHHVAVVFIPGESPDVPVQVKQYLDGRLESSAIIPGKVRAASKPAPSSELAAMTDALWLGCRLGSAGPKRERFKGDLDELFIADCVLEPQQIVQLMTDNRLAGASELAVAVVP